MALKKGNTLSFDVQVRTKKKEWIFAASLSIKNSSNKKESQKNIKKYLDMLSEGNSGSYIGEDKQFKSYYTLLLELGVISNTSGDNYKLSPLAEKVATLEISPKEYLTKVFYNFIYYNTVLNEVVHVLKEIVSYMKKNKKLELEKGDFKKINKLNIQNSDQINQIFVYMKNTNFFIEKDSNTLIWNDYYDIIQVLNKCVIPEIDIEELSEQEKYSNFLTKENSEKFISKSTQNLNNSLQKIVYGAPGTGKSYFLSEEANKMFSPSNIERVTFYDGYSYGQFVGMYKPASDDENNIIYKYVPGPLMRILVKALNNPEENYCLIIEEINRAKADKVFGNIFQLLDRNSDGESRYKISVSEEQESYLTEEGINIENSLYLPKNLYIWATMNSADEGVQPLDTAFKRRWKFKYMSLNEKEEEFLRSKDGKELVAFKTGTENILWNNFRKVLNSILSSNHITEDKLLAPFFISPSDFEEVEGIEILNQDVFIEKVLMYIYDDLLRHYPKAKKEIFSEEIKTFSDIYEKSKDSNFENIFNDSFKEKIKSSAEGN